MGVVYLSGLLCLVSLGLILGWCYYVWVGACFVVNYPFSFPFFFFFISVPRFYFLYTY